MSAAAPTLDEVREWEATVPPSKAAKALGISKSHLNALIRNGEAPVKVLRLGGCNRVITASLVRLLEGA